MTTVAHAIVAFRISTSTKVLSTLLRTKGHVAIRYANQLMIETIQQCMEVLQALAN